MPNLVKEKKKKAPGFVLKLQSTKKQFWKFFPLLGAAIEMKTSQGTNYENITKPGLEYILRVLCLLFAHERKARGKTEESQFVNSKWYVGSCLARKEVGQEIILNPATM